MEEKGAGQICPSLQGNNSSSLLVHAGETRLSEDDHYSIYTKLAPHADKWRDIGRELGFKEGEMNIIENVPKLMMQAPRSWLRQMLTQWLQWAPRDGRGSAGFATKESLHHALLKAGLGQLAYDQLFQ